MWFFNGLCFILCACAVLGKENQYGAKIPSKVKLVPRPERGGLIYKYRIPTTFVRPVFTYQLSTTAAPARGYVYKPPTTTTTTSTTTPPSVEFTRDIDSQGLTPPTPSPVPLDQPGFEIPVDPPNDSPDKWDIRDSVPGTPGDDYPALGYIPKTSFTCEGRIPGFYADPETRCQVYHRCSDCEGNVRLQMDSFLCPNGTQFNQEILTCDWWANVHCDTATQFYALNKELNTLGPDGKYLQLSGRRQTLPLLEKKVAPTVIPREERRPLPQQYRNPKNFDYKNEDGGDERQRPENESKRFQLFQPDSQKPTSADEGISDPLNNPDYFETLDDLTDGTKNDNSEYTLPSEDDYNFGNDKLDYNYDFNGGNDQIQVRSGIGFDQKLDNTALVPQSKSSPFQLLSKASSGRSSTTKAPKPSFATTKAPKTTLPTRATTELPQTTFLPTTTKPKKIEILPFASQPRGNFEASSYSLPINRAKENQRNRDKVVEQLSLRLPVESNFESYRVSDYLPPQKNEVRDYLPPATEAPPAYLPPTTEKPKLSYLPPYSETEHGGQKALYLLNPLPNHVGNLYSTSPILQQPLIALSNPNYLPLGGTYGSPGGLSVVQPHIPSFTYPQIPTLFSAPNPISFPHLNVGSFQSIPPSNYLSTAHWNTY